MNNTNPLDHFSSLEDYRDTRYTKHRMLNIVAISICAIICGARDWYDIEDFGKNKVHWLRTFLDIGDSVPSHDTYQRFFSFVRPDSLEQCFSSWIAAIADLTDGRLIHIDGKTLRGSKGADSEHFVHMVSAWCSLNGLVLGQQKVDDKSNEITAIPALLNLLVIKGCVVTIDAIGCQQEIAATIVDQGGDYILAVKDNQKFLHDDIQEAFVNEKNVQHYKAKAELNHGRIENRSISVITNMDWICNAGNWEGLQSLIKVDTAREDKRSGSKQAETRYYISSSKATAEYFHGAIRSHWQIENTLHWVLDVVFGEDASKKQAGNSAQNFSLLNKIALNLLRHYEVPGYTGAKKLSIKRKRNIAAWQNEHVLHMLFKNN